MIDKSQTKDNNTDKEDHMSFLPFHDHLDDLSDDYHPTQNNNNYKLNQAEISHINNLVFNPLILNENTRTTDVDMNERLDPDIHFFGANTDGKEECDYLVEDQFKNLTNVAFQRQEIFSIMHLPEQRR